MRALAADEIEHIAGGLAKHHPNVKTLIQTLSTISVTAPRPGPPNSGILMPIPTPGQGAGGGGPAGGGGGGGGGMGNTSVTEQEVENAFETAIEEAEAGTLGSTISGDVFTAKDFGTMAAKFNSTQMTYGLDSYTQFERAGDNSLETPGYGEFIHWDRVDWSAYDEGGTASALEAMNNMFHDLNVNHHVALNSTSTW